MATLIKGLLSFNLDWQFVLVGAFLSITVELCGVKSLSFAVGAYLPLSTTLPIFVGGALKGIADAVARKKGEEVQDSELSSGSLFATGLVAGGTLLGVVAALLSAYPTTEAIIKKVDFGPKVLEMLGETEYHMLGVAAFALMGLALFRTARKPLGK